MASTKCVSISPPSHGKGVHMWFRSNPPPPLVPNPHSPWHPGPPLGTQAPPPLVPTCLLDESLNSPRTGAWYQWGWSLGTKAGGVSRGWCRSQFTETRNGHRFVFTISEAISICFFTTSCRNTNVNLIAKCFIAEAHANTNKMMTYTKNSKTLNEFHYDFYSPLPDGHQLMLTTKYKQLDDTNHKQPKISRWNKNIRRWDLNIALEEQIIGWTLPGEKSAAIFPYIFWYHITITTWSSLNNCVWTWKDFNIYANNSLYQSYMTITPSWNHILLRLRRTPSHTSIILLGCMRNDR